jgi:hypothetical protein
MVYRSKLVVEVDSVRTQGRWVIIAYAVISYLYQSDNTLMISKYKTNVETGRNGQRALMVLRNLAARRFRLLLAEAQARGVGAVTPCRLDGSLVTPLAVQMFPRGIHKVVGHAHGGGEASHRPSPQDALAASSFDSRDALCSKLRHVHGIVLVVEPQHQSH